MGDLPLVPSRRCWFCRHWSSGENVILLVLGLHCGGEAAKLRILLAEKKNVTEKIIAAHGDARRCRACCHVVSGGVMKSELIAGRKRLHVEDGWEFDADRVLNHVGIREVDRRFTFFLGD